MFARTDPDSGETVHPPMELVRLAIPRRVYTQSHIDYVIEAVSEVYQRRKEIRGLAHCRGTGGAAALHGEVCGDVRATAKCIALRAPKAKR